MSKYIDQGLKDTYGHGQCASLAMAVLEHLKLPCVVFYKTDPSDDSAIHVANAVDGGFLDIYGIVTHADLEKRYGCELRAVYDPKGEDTSIQFEVSMGQWTDDENDPYGARRAWKDCGAEMRRNLQGPSGDFVSDGKVSKYIEQPAGAKPLGDLYANWDRFADVPVSEDGAIEAPFLHFDVGAERETIWLWFESQNPRFIVGDVMNGIRHEDERNLSNYIEQPAASQDKAVDLKNTLGQVATAPFYIWANDDCANKANNFKEAKAIRLTLFNEGGESVHIVDADGVEVVDAEIEAHEALVNAGYFAGARKPEVKPEFHGAFMVNDPQDSEGFAIVGDDIASLILEARDRLIEPASEREMKKTDAERLNDYVVAFEVGRLVSRGAINDGTFDGQRLSASKHALSTPNEDVVSECLLWWDDAIKSGLLVERNLSNYIEHPASGKTGTFAAKYDQHAERNGQTFTVLGAVDPKTYDAEECGTMYCICFADGAEIEAWPEEVETALVARSPVDCLCQSGHNPT